MAEKFYNLEKSWSNEVHEGGCKLSIVPVVTLMK